MLKCPECGEENKDRELYCAKCRRRLPSISTLRSTMRKGIDALDNADYRIALEKFTDVVSQNPGDMDAWFLMAAVKMRLGRGSEGWEDLMEVGIARETGRCAHCKGTGKCRECGGPGICIMCRGTKRCSYCGGTGKCPTCKGVRSEECNHCKGSGECIRCKGSKECSYCNGYGHCSECKGTGNCTHCGGSGVGHELDLSGISKDFLDLRSWFT